MAEFRMPALGADMDSGTVVEWLVSPGDTVHRGDVVAVVDTDKSAIDVECFESGVIERLLVEPGQRVPVGAPLALITAAVGGEPGPGAEVRVLSAPPHRTSPLTRKVAAQAGLDIQELQGTGPGGVVTREDVERAARVIIPRGRPRSVALAGAGRAQVSPYARRLAEERGLDLAELFRVDPHRSIHARDLPSTVAPTPQRAPQTVGPGAAAPSSRAGTAALMARSKREIPHYYLRTELDMQPALDWLRQYNREVPVSRRVLPAAVLLRAVALSAWDVPELNGHWLDDRFLPGSGVHLGVAVSLRGGGLAAPVIHDAHVLGLDGLMEQMRGAAERARAARLRSSEVSGATITVTNLGDLGVDEVTGVIHPPQVGLVGFGAIRRRPWVDGDVVAVRPTVVASLAADHRASDGATGARLLHAIDQHLHRPDELA
jgi:pyruvate dehydrogenase E2 component (dihydrolipoamide acetyltransferase)